MSININTFTLVPVSSVRNLTTSTSQLNATSIFVRWSVPVLNDLNGVLLSYYIIYYGIEIDTDARVVYLSNPGFRNQSIILTNLEEYTTYSINISAYTKIGKGPDAIVEQRTNQDGELYFYLFEHFKKIHLKEVLLCVLYSDYYPFIKFVFFDYHLIVTPPSNYLEYKVDTKSR